MITLGIILVAAFFLLPAAFAAVAILFVAASEIYDNFWKPIFNGKLPWDKAND